MKHILTLMLLILAPSIASAQSAPSSPTPEDLEHDPVRVTMSDGYTLSAFVSRPIGTTTRLPAVFLTQWVSCGSIAPDPERLARAEELALAADHALIRVDRAGSGTSEGPGCDKLDYETEVRHYREAFDQLAAHEWVDPDRIVIYGSSLGSTTAPLVAQGKQVAGVVVQGAGALTYFERMLHFDRIQLERDPNWSPEAIDKETRRRMEFQRLYLHHQMTPEAIAKLRPDLADIWKSLRGTDAAPHYGRPYAWHWQAAQQDWLAAWAKLEVPVMVVFGEFEQFERRHGHRIIVDTINRLRPGSATWLEIKRAGHGLRIYDDIYSAYLFERGESQPELFTTPVARWLRKINY